MAPSTEDAHTDRLCPGERVRKHWVDASRRQDTSGVGALEDKEDRRSVAPLDRIDEFLDVSRAARRDGVREERDYALHQRDALDLDVLVATRLVE